MRCDHVIKISYFPQTAINKMYLLSTVMRLLSTIHLCVLGNVCKQTTLEITEVTCTRGTVMDYL